MCSHSKTVCNIPRVLERGLNFVHFLPDACVVSESAAVHGGLRAGCLQPGFYLHPSTVRETLCHLSLKKKAYQHYHGAVIQLFDLR